MNIYYRFHAETSPPKSTSEKMVRVRRANDPYFIELTVPESELDQPKGVGVPDYRRIED